MRRTGLAVVVVACAMVAGCYERDVPERELRELLTDTTVRGFHELDRYSFERHYHADGRFEQTIGPSGTGRWWISGSTVCVVWDPPYPKTGRALCRRMVTDDDGAYWKEMTKRNGDTATVVTYRAFVAPDGADRRRIPGALERWRRWMLTWRGLVVVVVLGGLLILVVRAYRAGKDDPASTRNRLRRRFARLRVGDKAVAYATLPRLDPSELGALLDACLRDARSVDVFWVTEALFQRLPADQAIAALWRSVSRCDDAAAQRALELVIRFLPGPAATIAATGGDVRFAYLLGTVHAARAARVQRKSAAEFEHEKKLALEYFEHVRAHAPGRPPELSELAPRGAPYREAPQAPRSTPDYGLLVGAAYEAMLYASFTAPTPRSSSSYAGGG